MPGAFGFFTCQALHLIMRQHLHLKESAHIVGRALPQATDSRGLQLANRHGRLQQGHEGAEVRDTCRSQIACTQSESLHHRGHRGKVGCLLCHSAYITALLTGNWRIFASVPMTQVMMRLDSLGLHRFRRFCAQ